MADTLLTLSELTTFVPALSSAPAQTVSVLLQTAQRMAERFCNREFLSQSVIERYSIGFWPRIYLKRYPVTSISCIKIIRSDSPVLVDTCGCVTNFNSEQTDLTETILDTGIEYTCNPANGVVEIRNDLTIYKPKNRPYYPVYLFEVSYTGGYDIAPDMIKYGIAQLTYSMYANTKSDPVYRSEKIGDYSYTKFDDKPLLSMDSQVAESFLPYVRRGVNGL